MPLAPALVHVLTALGVVCALMAALAVVDARYETMFAWLGLAFAIDGLDGPLARAANVKERLARFSGERLDLIIDYLTYVFIPVLAMLMAGLLPAAAAIPLAAAALMSSLFHFSDTASKADDNSFVGFPAVWNIVVFYLFVFQLPPWVAAAIAVLCVMLTFLPIRWLHPLRVVAWRIPTLAVLVLFSVAAAAAVYHGFAQVPGWGKAALAFSAVYALSVPLLADANKPLR